jgi:hypothetical protein
MPGVPRQPVRRDRLEAVIGAFDRRRRLVAVQRLRGGTKKGVYRVTLDDDSTVVVYLWDTAENYWPDNPVAGDASDPFAPADGLDLFESARDALDRLGVRTPRLHFADRSRALVPADVAVLEDVPGPTLEGLLRDDPQAAGPVLHRLGDALRTMHQQRLPRFGRVGLVDRGGATAGSCERLVLDRALRDLADARGREALPPDAADRVGDRLHERFAAVVPRQEYGLVHGELGPDHVLVDGQGRPAVIDIEGLMYFDVEWEHVFLRLRFEQHYGPLAAPGLDGHRLRFYALAMHLSLVAGPLRLLDGDFPDRAWMLSIVEWNLHETLRLTDAGRSS